MTDYSWLNIPPSYWCSVWMPFPSLHFVSQVWTRPTTPPWRPGKSQNQHTEEPTRRRQSSVNQELSSAGAVKTGVTSVSNTSNLCSYQRKGKYMVNISSFSTRILIG